MSQETITARRAFELLRWGGLIMSASYTSETPTRLKLDIVTGKGERMTIYVAVPDKEDQTYEDLVTRAIADTNN